MLESELPTEAHVLDACSPASGTVRRGRGALRGEIFLAKVDHSEWALEKCSRGLRPAMLAASCLL